MKFIPFAFGAAGYPLCGPEQFLYNILRQNYEEAGRVVEGSPDQLISVALQASGGSFGEDQLRRALDFISTGVKRGIQENKPLISVEGGVVRPTEHFGIMG